MTKILIVEDNNDSRGILVLMLTNRDISLIAAQNSKEAVRGARTNNPHFYGYGATGF